MQWLQNWVRWFVRASSRTLSGSSLQFFCHQPSWLPSREPRPKSTHSAFVAFHEFTSMLINTKSFAAVASKIEWVGLFRRLHIRLQWTVSLPFFRDPPARFPSPGPQLRYTYSPFQKENLAVASKLSSLWREARARQCRTGEDSTSHASSLICLT